MFGLRKRVEEIRRLFESMSVNESRIRATEDRALGNRIRSAYDVIDSVNDRVDDLKANTAASFNHVKVDVANLDDRLSDVQYQLQRAPFEVANRMNYALGKENKALRDMLLDITQRQLNPIVIVPGDDQLSQQAKSFMAADAPYVHASRNVLTQPAGERWRYGQGVCNTVTWAAYERASKKPNRELSDKLYDAAYGIIVPRPANMPERSPFSGEAYVWVLCDDGKVRGTKASHLRAY